MTETKLTWTQATILEAAAGRGDGALLPAPDTVKAKGGALKACVKSLLDRRLAREVKAEGEQAWRTDEGGKGFGLAITNEGRQAIGLATEPEQPRANTKTAQLVDRLSAAGGASIAELTEAFGWQPHSARAALTGLRKRGYAIERIKRPDGVAAYRIETEATDGGDRPTRQDRTGIDETC